MLLPLVFILFLLFVPGLILGSGLKLVDQHLVYPRAVHVHHLEAETVPVHILAGLGDVLEHLENQTADGVVVVVGRQVLHVEVAR